MRFIFGKTSLLQLMSVLFVHGWETDLFNCRQVKTDTVLLMLKKEEESKTWPYVTEREDKKK